MSGIDGHDYPLSSRGPSAVGIPEAFSNNEHDGKDEGGLGGGQAHDEQGAELTQDGVGRSELGGGHDGQPRAVEHQFHADEHADKGAPSDQGVEAQTQQQHGHSLVANKRIQLAPLFSNVSSTAPTMAASSTTEMSSKGSVYGPSSPAPKAFTEMFLGVPAPVTP